MTDPAELRTGWSTGCCAALAAKAATGALLGGQFPDLVSIKLPQGQEPQMQPVQCMRAAGWAECGIIKDAGDDPDVTHGAMVRARVAHQRAEGLRFVAGEGVGVITRPGLPLPVGEPAINPVPRRMISQAVQEAAQAYGARANFEITISIPNGAELAKQTWNGRLGIVGGLSILGTTGIVRPFSCAAWIASIHRGIDVAVAEGKTHVIAATGNMSEQAARARHDLSENDCLDMGDFVAGTLKYLRRKPVARLTLAGGIGKFTKLAMGMGDLHSKRSPVDFAALEDWLADKGVVASVHNANSVMEIYERLGTVFAELVAREAQQNALAMLQRAPVAVELLVVDRAGEIIARSDFQEGSA